MSMFIEHVLLEKQFDDTNIDFQTKILEKSGFSEETCLHPSLCRLPRTRSLSLSIEEAATVMFSMVADLLQKKDISPKAIDILITNCSIYCPTPSLSAMVINKFKMRSNIMGYNLSGMGCSAGIIAVGLAKDLLRAHPNSLALIVSSEILSQDWYDGKDRSMKRTTKEELRWLVGKLDCGSDRKRTVNEGLRWLVGKLGGGCERERTKKEELRWLPGWWGISAAAARGIEQRRRSR
ncbi:hypothetical protein RJ640_007340 [Escallonia rubra]|uniref:FAE domain-containing protein n=1 Tax=Escallonia rubra TaxID=112253 RepID=A0AA88RN04_9ASTE|nr:hypothetical protein RJ640_007340 [Escallonia rubra]